MPNQMLRLRFADSQTTDLAGFSLPRQSRSQIADGRRGIIQLMSAGFLDQLATQLRINKTTACRRAIQRILDVIKKEYERGKFGSHTEAENDFRRLVDREEPCK